MASDLNRYFRVEAREILEQLGRGVLELERGGAEPDLVARLLRLAHTLKGASRVVKQQEIAENAHAIEDALAPFREVRGPVPRSAVDAVLARLDAIQARTAALGPEAAPGAARAERPTHDEPPGRIGADLDEMDGLMDGISEASVRLAELRRSLLPLARGGRVAQQLSTELASLRASRPLNGAGPRVRSMAAELHGIVETLERTLTAGIEEMDRELRQVREAAERLRLLPASLMFGALERALRDAAQSLGRDVALTTRGGDVRLDPDVLAVVQRAMVQAVRNAVAHGIEPAGERVAAGKPRAGAVVLEVVRRGNKVAFVCRDDGRGVDLELVRRVVERRGALPADANRLAAKEILALLLRGGITTTGAVTEMSGRGIGLDVVREAAGRLGGEARVETERGKGTTLEIVAPVSLSSIDVLVVEAGGWTAAIPLASLRTTVRVADADLLETTEGVTVPFDGGVVPFAPLARLLGGPEGARARVWSAVVLEDADGLAALGVDRLRGTATVVVRPIADLGPFDPVVAGASFDAEGNPQLVLDPDRLVRQTRSVGPGARPAAAPPPVVLVIDDSLTTRMLEQSILESAGYDVDVAVSGEDALEKARARRYALFLVDVEMPGIDGFEFIERTRADAALRDVPAILVTSRASPEDRQRGARAGASAHIVKSDFEQSRLLEEIRALVGPR